MSAITHEQLVQNYEVVRVLGEGSFGKVFLVRHKITKIQFAMKKYSKYHILKNGKQKSLIRSSKILQVLYHENIIKFLYYAIGDQDDQIFLIFQACKKGSLEQIKQLIYKMKQMSLIKEIMYQLAQGLAYLKSVAVAHRDIKPSNISFNSEGVLKIIDFDEAICFKQLEEPSNREEGFAKQLSMQTSTLKIYSRRSRANSFVGTQLYMSPEMRNMTITDQRGDTWAYGCILYQLISGKSFINQCEEDDDTSAIICSLRQQLASQNVKTKQIDEIQDLLKKILKQNPDQRLSIQMIMSHEFFNNFNVLSYRKQYKKKLRKFLRGNYNLSDPRNILDALNMDLIGMKSSSQKFLSLSQYPILINYEILKISSNDGLIQRIKKLWKQLTTVFSFKVCYIFGGSKYFKSRSSVHQDDKSYIFYDQIDTIKIIEDAIIIQGSNTQKWNEQNRQSKQNLYRWRYIIKTLSNSNNQLGVLYDTLQYICND